MRLRLKSIARLFLVLCLSQTAFAAPARASSFLLVNSSIMLFLQSATSQCFVYSYDRNGNRLARGNQAYVARGFWGSSTYGCFNWSV